MTYAEKLAIQDLIEGDSIRDARDRTEWEEVNTDILYIIKSLVSLAKEVNAIKVELEDVTEELSATQNYQDDYFGALHTIDDLEVDVYNLKDDVASYKEELKDQTNSYETAVDTLKENIRDLEDELDELKKYGPTKSRDI